MKLDDFDFDLPEDLIATRPARPRSARRGCWWPRATRSPMRRSPISGTWLRAGDRLVLNDTRVIPARLRGCAPRGRGAGRGSA